VRGITLLTKSPQKLSTRPKVVAIHVIFFTTDNDKDREIWFDVNVHSRVPLGIPGSNDNVGAEQNVGQDKLWTDKPPSKFALRIPIKPQFVMNKKNILSDY
jgi:hypothetical protein